MNREFPVDLRKESASLASIRSASMANEMESLRRCPLCEATIPEGHSKCLFCGSIIETEPEEAPEPTTAGPDEWLITAAYVLVGISALALWLGVGRLGPLWPRSWLFFSVLVITQLAVALVVARDAARIDVKSHGYSVPIKWFVATMFLMPLALLVYAAVRARCGAKDRTRLALALVIVWLGCAVGVGHALLQQPTLPPALQREFEQQLNRTLEVRNPNAFDPQATIAPPSPPN
jgi:hypothetical protein